MVCLIGGIDLNVLDRVIRESYIEGNFSVVTARFSGVGTRRIRDFLLRRSTRVCASFKRGRINTGAVKRIADRLLDRVRSDRCTGNTVDIEVLGIQQLLRKLINRSRADTFCLMLVRNIDCVDFILGSSDFYRHIAVHALRCTCRGNCVIRKAFDRSPLRKRRCDSGNDNRRNGARNA